jgi:hypothetical protein
MQSRIRLAASLALVLSVVLLTQCKPGNQPPVIGSFTAPDTVYPGTAAPITCSVSDPESDPVTCSWTCAGGTLSPDTGTSVTWTAPGSSATVRVTVKAKDSHNGEDTYYKDIVVTAAANRPPSIADVAGPDSVSAGGNAALTCNASDPDGDTVTYAWSCNTGGLSGTSGQSVTWYAPDTAASAVITVIASDGQAADTATRNISVTPAANRPPIIDSVGGPTSVPAKDDAQYTCFASDPDGDSISFSWACQRGHLSSTSGRTVTWTAPETSGSVTVTCTARDGRGGEDVRPKTVSVTKVTTTWLDTMVSIPALGSKAYYGTMRQGYTVFGNFTVADGYDINFYIMDSVNYYKWANNQSDCQQVAVHRVIIFSGDSRHPRLLRRDGQQIQPLHGENRDRPDQVDHAMKLAGRRSPTLYPSGVIGAI